MGLAPAAHVMFNKFMNFNPKNPDWLNRDRFVLSYVASIFDLTSVSSLSILKELAVLPSTALYTHTLSLRGALKSDTSRC